MWKKIEPGRQTRPLSTDKWAKSRARKLSKRLTPYKKSGNEYITVSEPQEAYELGKASEIFSITEFEHEPLIVSYRQRGTRGELAKDVLAHIESEITKSSYVLELKDGWNEENSKEISKEVYFSSIYFLREYAKYLCSELNVIIPAPEINPCPDGSIDLSWQTEKTRMLINFKIKEQVTYAFYFGDNYGKKPVKGNIPSIEFEESLAIWMKKLA